MLLDSGAATAGRLSELMGLTSGAVTRVIDRLEQAGYVRRVPDPADRRRVIVELIPEKMAAVQATMAQFGEKTAAEIATYSDADLAVIDDFLTRMAAVTRDEANALRDTPDREAGATVRVRGPDRRPGSRPSAVQVRRERAPDPRHRRLGRPLSGHVRRAGPAGQAARRDRHHPAQGTPAVGLARPARRRVAQHARSRGTSRWSVGPTSSRASSPSLDLRSFELTGGVDQLRLTLGRPTGIVPIRLIGGANHARFERPAGVPVQLRISGAAGRIEFDHQKLGGTAGPSLLESAGAATASDRFVDRGQWRREPDRGRRDRRLKRPRRPTAAAAVSADRRRSARSSGR